MKNSHICNPLTLQNAFVNVQQHKPGDPQSAQLGNTTTGTIAATTNRKITRYVFYFWCLEYECWQCVWTCQKTVTSKERPECITIMYIYHALINALSAYMIHINLNMIFYTHVEHSSTQTTHTKHHMERQPPQPPPTHKNKKPQSIQCVQHWSVSISYKSASVRTYTKRLRQQSKQGPNMSSTFHVPNSQQCLLPPSFIAIMTITVIYHWIKISYHHYYEYFH